jgi:hypothetical protein
MKVGDIVICINDRNSIGLKSSSYTKGKCYEVLLTGFDSSHQFYIKSDNGTHPAVERKNFMTLKEYRNSKLKEIGI